MLKERISTFIFLIYSALVFYRGQHVLITTAKASPASVFISSILGLFPGGIESDTQSIGIIL
jgi:hypothetical protein